MTVILSMLLLAVYAQPQKALSAVHSSAHSGLVDVANHSAGLVEASDQTCCEPSDQTDKSRELTLCQIDLVQVPVYLANTGYWPRSVHLAQEGSHNMWAMVQELFRPPILV